MSICIKQHVSNSLGSIYQKVLQHEWKKAVPYKKCVLCTMEKAKILRKKERLYIEQVVREFKKDKTLSIGKDIGRTFSPAHW